ncbi:tRNA (adenosine(37)-N6)-threonylcarbamoyltransferase complex ATPase subunit type 1 TsaE [Patescibacteria group bacterium]|nr:tRNA (adenosine(37)-N6)-threonylcarbamoyltransferase complex ATPase subunit type 1 TsaE [Patescibacteria group bacterium]
MKAHYVTKTPEETIELGRSLATSLSGGDVILLFGDLGSGKTHFTKGIAAGLGITDTIKSPTFAYVRKYILENPRSEIRDLRYFYHYDLYRLNLGDDLTSIGYEESILDDKAINVIEWADRIVEKYPAKHIKVEFISHEEEHSIMIEFFDSEIVPEEKIEQFYEEWSCPMHVRAHIKQVSSVAMQIAQQYVTEGEIVNLNLLYTAAMLHDLTRICDFHKLDKDLFNEDISDGKWNKWKEQRKKWEGIHHADIAFEFFNGLGYSKTAELIRIHKSRIIAEEPEVLNTLEKKIMYYADKRVKHDEIVDLDERFRDGWERYGQYNDTQTRQLFEKIEKLTHELQNELFDGIEISPEDIQ